MAARKIALVGIGKIARDQHIPSIAASDRWELSAAVSRHGTVEGVETFDDFETMLAARPDIEVVSLTMPPVPRYAYAQAALAAGRHVMLEKPPGATLSECHALAAQADAAGRCLFATWHSREAAQVDAAKSWLAGRRLTRLQVTWKEDVRRWHPGQEWIWQAGGLGVLDPGINALSIVTAILPDPIHLSGAELKFPAGRETPIAVDLTFAHPHGAAVSAAFDWRQEGDQTWEIEADTTDGSLRLTEGGARLFIDNVEQASGGATALGGEYPRLYARMAALVDAGTSDVDLAPLVHVADAFMLGRRTLVAPFSF